MMSNPHEDSSPIASTSHFSPVVPIASQTRSNGTNANPRSTKSRSHSFTTDLASYLEQQFIPNVKPTKEEYTIKETQRLFLQQLADTVSKGAILLPFGSMANGFALKNSDMDLCCFLGKDAPTRSAAELVEVLGRLIEKETNFQVKMLPRARIPIIKLTLPPSPTIPFGMQCDIGFENRLALENTRLLLTYALVDNRLRTLVLFLKVWTKRRKINNPYLGTLSSYGYVLLVIYFLAHVKGPPVLPNLQRIPPSRQIPPEELEYEGHDIYFYDDLESLPAIWQSSNLDNSGQLLIEFFKFFSKDFLYNSHVISIRSEGGLISKEAKGWPTEPPLDGDFVPRDQHKLCIEDPFQLDYNVARTVTTDGLYTIRGEFIRAYRTLTSNPTERISTIINEVCEEREDFLVPHPPPSSFSSSNPSPRRRSAPSSQYSNQPHYQPPHANAPGMEDFRIWAAKNGVTTAANGYSALDTSAGSSRRHPTREEGWEVPPSPAYQYSSIPPPSSSQGGSYYQSHQTQNHLQHSNSSSSSSSSRRHHPGPLYPVPPPPAQSTLQDSLYSRSQPNSTSGSMPWLERRVSWDGAPTATPPPPPTQATTTTGVAPMPITTRPTGTYDLHKFFQNPSSSESHGPMNPHEGGGGGYQHQGPGRSPYRYSPFTSSTNMHYSRGPSTSLPPRPTYPFPSSSLPTTPSQYYPPQQFQHPQQSHHHHHPASSQSPTIQPARYHHPGPFAIFPIEDRETIIQANTITFGNFDQSLQPLFPFSYPSYPNSTTSPSTGYPSPTFSHPSHPANGFGSTTGLMEGLLMEESIVGRTEQQQRGRTLSSSLPGSTLSPSLAHNVLPAAHLSTPSAAGLLFEPHSPPRASSHSATSLEAYRTRFRDLHARTRGRSMPHSSTLRTGIEGLAVEEDKGDTEEEGEEGETEREVAMVKFGQVETEFFLPFPKGRRNAPPIPSSAIAPFASPIVAALAGGGGEGGGEVDSPDEMSEKSIEVDSSSVVPAILEDQEDGKGMGGERMEIPRFNTIPPTPVKQQRAVIEPVELEEEIVLTPIPPPPTTTTKEKKSKSRSNSLTTARINGTRSPKLIPTSSPLPKLPCSSSPSIASPKAAPTTPPTTTTMITGKSKSSPKLPSSPLMNGITSWANVAGSGGDRVGPIRLAAMNGIAKLNLATTKRTVDTSSPSSSVVEE